MDGKIYNDFDGKQRCLEGIRERGGGVGGYQQRLVGTVIEKGIFQWSFSFYFGDSVVG